MGYSTKNGGILRSGAWMNGMTEPPFSEGGDKEGRMFVRQMEELGRLNSGAIKINVPWSYSGRIGVRNLGFRGEDRVGYGRTYSLNP